MAWRPPVVLSRRRRAPRRKRARCLDRAPRRARKIESGFRTDTLYKSHSACHALSECCENTRSLASFLPASAHPSKYSCSLRRQKDGRFTLKAVDGHDTRAIEGDAILATRGPKKGPNAKAESAPPCDATRTPACGLRAGEGGGRGIQYSLVPKLWSCT